MMIDHQVYVWLLRNYFGVALTQTHVEQRIMMTKIKMKNCFTRASLVLALLMVCFPSACTRPDESPGNRNQTQPISGKSNDKKGNTVGMYIPAEAKFYLHNSSSVGNVGATFAFGLSNLGWVPVSGDWDGDGSDSVGLNDPGKGVWYLKNSNSAGNADLTFAFGLANSGWVPVSGDWDGDGSDSVGLYDPGKGVWYLKNSNSAGNADLTFA